MPENLFLLVVLVTLVVVGAILWLVMRQPQRFGEIHLDFGAHKDRETHERFIYKER